MSLDDLRKEIYLNKEDLLYQPAAKADGLGILFSVFIAET